MAAMGLQPQKAMHRRIRNKIISTYSILNFKNDILIGSFLLDQLLPQAEVG
jgi:hypothetical protein